MQISVENLSTLERRLTIQFPVQPVNADVQKRLADLQKKVTVSGFRAGKVPLNLIEQRYKQSVRQDVILEHVQNTLLEAFKEKNLQPVQSPLIESINSNSDTVVEYKARFEIYPTVELKDLASVEIEKPVCQVTEADLETQLQKLQKMSAEWKEVEQPAKEGSQVVFQLTCTVEGQADKHLNQRQVRVELGTDRISPELTKALTGAKKDDALTFTVTPTSDDPSFGRFAGQSVDCALQVKQVLNAVLPELNEAFFKSLNPETADLESFKAYLKGQMESWVTRELSKLQEQKVYQALLNAHPLSDLPKTLVSTEFDRLKHELQHSVKKWIKYTLHHHEDLPEEVRENLQQKAEDQVTLRLVTQKMVSTYDIPVDQNQLQEQLRHYQAHFAQKKNAPSQEEITNWLKAEALQKNLLDYVVSKAKSLEKNYNYQELFTSSGH